MAETTIKVKSLRADSVNGTFATEYGQVTFDANGEANLPVKTAAALYANPDFDIPDEKDVVAVKECIENGLAAPDAYDAGELVRARCRDLTGTVTAPDGSKVLFGNDGYALIGINTANSLKDALGEKFTFEAIEEATKKRGKTAADKAAAEAEVKAAADKAKADAEAAKVPKVVSTEIPNNITVDPTK